jgi:beta-mannosidase
VEYFIEKAENGFVIHLSTDVLARNIYMQIGDLEGFFSDNYFDLLPGGKANVFLSSKSGEEAIKSAFTIRTLVDAFPVKMGR